MVVVVDEIVNACISLYMDLPDKVKPTEHEWTVISAIVGVVNEKDIIVLSLGTGSKCIGKSLMSSNGDILNDSHAEVIARRAFLKYLYREIISYGETFSSDIIDIDGTYFVIKNSVKFYFVTSMLPCGDATIMPKTEMCNKDLMCTEGVPLGKRKLSGENDEPKKMKLDCDKNLSSNIADIHRTGAKCLPGSSIQDLRLPGALYHNIGAVRTKPGRGDPTLSLSCSDKIARWNAVGWQGALLSFLIREPIAVDAIICGDGCPFSQESFNRAVNKRINRTVFTPIHKATVPFPHAKTENRKPSPISLIWSRTSGGGDLEVAVNGRKQGVTKKNLNKKVGRTSICKRELFALFETAVNSLPGKESLLKNIIGENKNATIKSLRYLDLKMASKDYQTRWKSVKDDCFKIWSNKPVELLNFTLEGD